MVGPCETCGGVGIVGYSEQTGDELCHCQPDPKTIMDAKPLNDDELRNVWRTVGLLDPSCDWRRMFATCEKLAAEVSEWGRACQEAMNERNRLRSAAILLWSALYSSPRLTKDRRDALEATKWVLDATQPVPR